MRGDFFVYHDSSLDGRLIQALTHSHWNHAGILIDEEGGIVEALGEGVTQGYLSKYIGTEYRIISVPLTDAERTQAVTTARAAIGEGYDRLAIAGFVIDAISGGAFIFGEAKHSFCSALVAICYASAGIATPTDPRRISPGDLMRWWKQTPQ